MNVDQIFVISLDTAEDRRNKFKQWYPPGVPFHFFLVPRMKNPEKGCFTSHQKVLIHAKEKNYDRVLVFEDDAFPRFPWKDIVHIVNKKLNQLDHLDPNWKILTLGYIPFRMHKTGIPDLYRVQCATDAHAYIINVKNLKASAWNKVPIDMHYFCESRNNRLEGNYFKDNEKSFGVYATRILFSQKADQSSIDPTHLTQNSFIEFTGGPDKMTELSTQVNVLNLGCFVFMIILILFIFLVLVSVSHIKQNSDILYNGFVALGVLFIIALVFLLSASSLLYTPNPRFNELENTRTT
jgi:hypothetical protein